MRKVLVANRGEIAVRIMRACRDLGIASVAVYSDADRAAPHVRYADEAYALGPSAPAQSYLHIEKLVDVARRAAADAVHPGYGFLAENEDFAAACRDAGLTFIGPSPEAIALMGSKTAARQTAARAGMPVVPGLAEPVDVSLEPTRLAQIAESIGFPILVKAVAGGGGKGMRTVERPEDLASAVRAAGSEAGSAFGDSSVYFERKLKRPRHIEIQVLADHHGRVVPFVERECSIQRRHQKVIEESPSIAVTPELRRRLAEAAASVARAAGYASAGTIETLLDEDGRFYFLEMNTRLQVEHPVTELVSGLDLVQWQIRVARGEALTIDPERTLQPNGHAIECRVYAEDPDRRFMPCPGRIVHLQAPAGPGIRRDSGVEAGFDVPVFYDSMISKLCAWGEDRPQAIARMRRALSEYDVRGIRTTIPFFQWMLEQPDFIAGHFDTTSLDRILTDRTDPFLELSRESEERTVVAAAIRELLRASSRSSDHGSTPRASGWALAARREALRN
ncbi:MAG: acetyl/propionyl/methylcrotonyl-CoA carboxylase subunit alpha [Vicinamibacterales bacterium]